MSLIYPDVADRVAADFAARGIQATVVFGDWKAAEHNAGNRVIIGTAVEFEDADLGFANAPGGVVLPGGTSQARTIFTMAETAQIWCHAAPPAGSDKDPTRLRETFKATMGLVKQTLRAMYLYAPGAFAWSGGAFLVPERAEFRFGAVATFRARYLTPVLDDAIPSLVPDGYNAETVAVMPSGDVVVGTVTYEKP